MVWLPNWLLSSKALLAKACRCIAHKQYDEAERAAQKAIDRIAALKSLSPDRRRQLGAAWLQKGRADLMLRREEAAESALSSAAQIVDLPDVELQWFLSRRLNRGDWSQVTRWLSIGFLTRREARASKTGREITSRMQIIASRLSLSYSIDNALQWYREAITATGDIAWLHLGLARLLCKMRQFADALPALRSAAKLTPDSTDVRVLLALTLTETGNHRAALREFAGIQQSAIAPEAVLLLAHVLRRLNQFDKAGQMFGQARKQGAKFAQADDLAHAEVLANLQQWVPLAELLSKHRTSPNKAWLWLTCATFSALAKHDQAMTVASMLTPDDLAACEALRTHTLHIASHASDTCKALDLLTRIQAQHRTAAWHGLAGHLYATRGHWQQAFNAWSSLPANQCAAAISGIIAAQATQTLPPWLEAADELTDSMLASDNITHALLRYIRQGAAALTSVNETGNAVALLGRLASCNPVLAIAARLRLIEVAEAAQDRHSLSEELSRIDIDAPALTLLRARAALADDDPDRAGTALQKLSRDESALSDREHATFLSLRAALAIMRNEAESASLLAKIADREDVAALLPFARLRTHAEVRSEHVATLPESLGRLLMNWSRVLRGETDELVLAADIVKDTPRAETVSLHGWLHLQEAHRAFSRGDQTRAMVALDEAAELWPGMRDHLEGNGGEWQPVVLLPSHPAAARDVIKNENRSIGDPSTSHRIALCWLGEAARHACKKEWLDAVRTLELSLTHWVVPICDDAWMRSWLRSRALVWNRKIDDNAVTDLRIRFAKYIERLAMRWSAAVVCTNTELAQRLQLAPVLWQAECHAATRLGELGGMPLNDGRTIVAGPGYLEENSLRNEFLEFVATSQLPGEWSNEMRDLMQQLGISAADLGEPPETDAARVDLRLRFSSLRAACALERNGELDRAIGSLRLARLSPPASIDDREWKLEAVDLAFDWTTDRDEYSAATAAILVDWLLKKGEHDIAAGGSLEDSINSWNEAIQLADAHDADADNFARQRTRRNVLGRCEVLTNRGCEEEARTLLEHALELLPGDEHLRSMLANFYVNVAVKLVNENANWDGALPWIRKAQQLAPELPRVMHQGAVCLHMVGRYRLEVGQSRQAASMFKEAASAAERCLEVAPDDQELRSLHAASNQGVLAATMRGLMGAS